MNACKCIVVVKHKQVPTWNKWEFGATKDNTIDFILKKQTDEQTPNTKEFLEDYDLIYEIIHLSIGNDNKIVSNNRVSVFGKPAIGLKGNMNDKHKEPISMNRKVCFLSCAKYQTVTTRPTLTNKFFSIRSNTGNNSNNGNNNNSYCNNTSNCLSVAKFDITIAKREQKTMKRRYLVRTHQK